jgi:hypothetical protein
MFWYEDWLNVRWGKDDAPIRLEEMLVKGILVFAAVIATALVLSSTAFANSLTCSHGPNCHSGNLGGGTPSTGGPSSGGTLPFTGLDLAGVTGLGGLLLVSGVTLHRLGKRRS